MARLEPYRTELTAYCYRMLGSPFEADDAVQEALTRAWKGLDRFEGRSSLRSWLYRIATNVCFDHLEGRKRRALPIDLGPANRFDQGIGTPLPESAWVLPVPDARVVPAAADPAEQAAVRESVRLAFVAALQHLPPRQRSVLVLREVLRFEASEVAELLDTTVASVNSALQRARATLGRDDVVPTTDVAALDAEHRALLDRYEDAFLRYDIEALVALLHEDATLTMPPFPVLAAGGTGGRPVLALARTGEVPRLPPDPGRGQRPARVRPVQALRRWHPPRGLVPPGRAGRGRRGRAHRLLPRHPDGVPAVRPAPGLARRLTRSLRARSLRSRGIPRTGRRLDCHALQRRTRRLVAGVRRRGARRTAKLAVVRADGRPTWRRCGSP